MDPFFLVIIVVLGILAVTDLAVGVANDAVNFLNASIGSRVAPHRVILIVAAVGILIGAMTSNGMMEVARKGVFHPEAFDFTEIMILFAAVMLSDVLLLNTFNRMGLPTSTTVSLVFELLGGAVGVALYHIWHDAGMTVSDLGNFINSGKALVIIAGILLSVVIAFTVGAVLMFLSRLLFSFRYRPMMRRFGAAWCGVAMAGIVYFALFKGLKDSGLIVPDFTAWVNSNLGWALLIAWGGCSLLLWLLQLLRVNILKVTILAGTAALALAFAGNDLVNFIGVPLAGWDAFRLGMASGDMHMGMGALAGAVKVSPWILLGTGVVMVVTLFVSRDAMKVSKTTVDLSSAREGAERFASSGVSRRLVRAAIGLSGLWGKIAPERLRRRIDERLTPPPADDKEYATAASYDHIRAVVNLTCAAMLICAGTMLQLPLSTTYVVFMVAMGTSLADRAWGRDSAVYRITGVLVVISGWFVTAVAGFTAAFVVALALMWGRWAALIIACLICGYILCANLIQRSHGKAPSSTKTADDLWALSGDLPRFVPAVLTEVRRLYGHTLASLYATNRHELHEADRQTQQFYDQAVARRHSLTDVMRRSDLSDQTSTLTYVQATDYVVEIAKALLHCARPAWEHVDNNHRPLTPEQIDDLKAVNDALDDLLEPGSRITSAAPLRNLVDDMVKGQIRRLKAQPDASTRASALFLDLLAETKTLAIQSRNLMGLVR